MSSQRNATSHGRARLLAVSLVALLASCGDAPGTVVPSPPQGLTDGGMECGETPEEGCACEPGTPPVECTLSTPVIRSGRVLCMRGTRMCRNALWSSCEDVSLYAPRQKDLGTPSPLDDCHPNDFSQTSTPDDSDLDSDDSHVTYSTNVPSGIILTTEPVGVITNFGLGIDTDGDGAPDTVDDCPTNPLRWILLVGEQCTDPPLPYSFFHILNPGDTAPLDPMNIQLEVNSVDTYILLDTTYSMIDEINNLRTGLSSLMGTITTVIPDAHLGVGMFRDYPVGLDSNNNDFPLMHLLDPTASVPTAQGIVNRVLNIDGNYFWPEAGMDALYSVASGRGIGPWVPNRICSNGGFGWPCFRPGSVPVVIVITDAPFWNGPSYLAGANELRYANYPGTAGRQDMAGVAVPAAVAVPGQIVGGNDTAATAFDIGDITSRSVTVIGSNDGGLVNNFTEACGGSTQSGADVFYEFSISQYQRVVFEAFGDYDPTLFLRPISGTTPTTIACDRDSGRVNDANAVAVWRTGAKIDSQTVPNAGSSTTTNVELTGCNASASTVNFPMTGCNVSTQTTNVDLASCVVPPDSTRTSTFSGCGISNTPNTVTYSGCQVPTTTTTTLNSCTMANEAPTMGFTGCSVENTPTVVTYTGCQVPSTTTTALSNCTMANEAPSMDLSNCSLGTMTVTGSLTGCDSRAQANLKGCSVNVTTPSATLTGCSVGTTATTFSGCSNGNNMLENCAAYYDTDDVYGSCYRDGTNTLHCNGVGNSDDIDGFFITGTGIPANTLVTGHSGWFDEIYVSNAITSATPGTVTVRRSRTLLSCTKVSGTQADPATGAAIFGSALLNAGTTISGAVNTGSGVWAVYLSQAVAGTGYLADVSSGTSGNSNLVMCSGMSGTAPVAGLPVTGTNVPANTTVSGYQLSGGYHRVTMSANATGATTAISAHRFNTTLTCTGKSGSNLTAGIALSGTNIAAGTVINSVTPGTGTGTQTITMNQNGTALGSTTVTATGATTYGPTLTCTSNVGTALANGMTLTGTNIPAGVTISSFSGLTITMSNTVSGPVSSDVYGRAGTRAQSNIITCTGATGTAPFVGMGITGSGVPSSQTLTSVTPFNTGYVVSIQSATSSTVTTASLSGQAPDYSRMVSCSRSNQTPSNATPSVGMVVTGTGLAAGTTTITAVTGAGMGPYTITLSQPAVSLSASLSSAVGASGQVLDKFIGCTTTGPAPVAGNAVGGTMIPNGTTISTVTGTGPYTITLSALSSSGMSMINSYTHNTPRLNILANCTRTGATNTLVNGMTLTGTSLITGTRTVSSFTGTSASPGEITMSGNATAAGSITTVTASAPGFNLSRMVNCTRVSPVPASTVPLAGMTLTGTSLGAGTTTIAAVSGSGPYTIDLSQPATSSTATLSTATGAAVPVLNKFTGCTTAGPTPAVGNTLAGSMITVGTTISTITGTGPYTITMSANAASSTGTLTSYTHNTPRLNVLENCTRTGPATTLVNGMTLTGTSLITGSPTVTGFTGTSMSPGTITMSANASATGTITTVTASQNVFNLSRLTNCLLAGGSSAPEIAMTLTGTNLAPGATISGATPQGGGLWTIDMSAPATSNAATATSATITTTTQRNQLNGCTVASGTLVAGMNLTGTLLAGGTTVSGFALAAGGTAPVGPYNITLSQNATATGASTAMGTQTVPLPQLTNCQGVGLFDPVTAIAPLAPYIPAGTNVTGFSGLGTAGNPWIIQLSQTPTAIGTNLALNGTIPGPTNTLTSCMIATGGPVLNNMVMSGDLIAGGSTISSFTGSGSGPYTIVLSDVCTGVGPTSAEGTITIPAGSGGLQYATGLTPGRYQLVVDSRTNNQPYESSPGRGTFQLRITNSAAPAAPTTHAAQVSWTDTIAALDAAKIKTIGIASCPPGCSNLTSRQTTYANCVQGNPVSRTSGADRTSLTTTRCGAAYANCIARPWGTVARCGPIFDECRAAEVAAGKQGGVIQTQACDATQSACLRLGTVSSSADCANMRAACRAPTSEVCNTERTSVTTCLNTDPSGTLVSDAAEYCYETRRDLSQLGIQTGSVRTGDNTPFVYQIEENGNGLTTTIADAVRDLAQYILFDVTASCEPATSPACQALFQSANIGTPNPSLASAPPRCASCSGPTCLQCTPGAELGYEIRFANPLTTGIAQTSTPQVFDFFIVLRDAFGVEMSSAPVRLVVPAAATSTISPSGTFTQIYDATLDTMTGIGCPYPGRRADWGIFTYSVTIPAGTSIEFAFRTNEMITGISNGTPVTHTVTATTATGSFDVGAAFEALGLTNSTVRNFMPYVEMSATLRSNAAQTATPVLHTYNMQFVCVDAE